MEYDESHCFPLLCRGVGHPNTTEMNFNTHKMLATLKTGKITIVAIFVSTIIRYRIHTLTHALNHTISHACLEMAPKYCRIVGGHNALPKGRKRYSFSFHIKTPKLNRTAIMLKQKQSVETVSQSQVSCRCLRGTSLILR